ncbi:Asp23/Gls24 family envelope stress response protein [Rathayibacter sp. Leaf248]|uniref:Asp23/Gls24 family envelope stress response protein n=1 Tax=Rathayibacter sp. Leaf248 TaxID=2876555 RepID=UPI001E5010D0|nr:Asp23/Gls24 family envelope stress response protein [Rathayibacter sp. Leaf248]
MTDEPRIDDARSDGARLDDARSDGARLDDARLEDLRLDPDVSLDDARPIDLGAVRADDGSPDSLLATTVAETALGVTGVHHLGGPVARSLDRASRAVLGTSTIPGVTISEDEGRTIIDLDLVAEYPHKVAEVMEEARTQVLKAASQVHASPIAVNITVTDVHGPFDPIEPEPVAEGDSLVEKAGDLADDARERLSDAGDRISDAAGAAADSAADALDSAADAAADSAADALDSAADAVDEQADRADERERAAADQDDVSETEAPRSDDDGSAPAQIIEVPTDGTAPVVVVVVEQPSEEPAETDERVDSAEPADPAESESGVERSHSVPAPAKTEE